MKNLLFCLAFVVALFQPTSSQAAINKANANFSVVPSQLFLHNYCEKNNDSYTADDLSALNDDDDEEHFSERKTVSINASNPKDSYSAAINFSDIFFKCIWYNRFHFQQHTALFIFLHSLRV